MSKLYWNILHEAFDTANSDWYPVDTEILKDKVSDEALKKFNDCLESNFSQLQTNDDGKYMYGDWYDDYIFDSLDELVKSIEYDSQCCDDENVTPLDEPMNLTESLQRLDNQHFDLYSESYELEQLYESTKTNLTSQQRSELRNVASHAKTAEEVFDTLSGMLNRQKNETLQEASYISSSSQDSKLTDVKMMHQIMLSMNNEDAYMSWIYTMPDQPTEEDFEYFADDDDEYNDLRETFDRIFKRYRKDGLYKPSTENVEWLQDNGYSIDILESYEKTSTNKTIEALTEDTVGENEVNFRDRAINGDLVDFNPQNFMDKVMKSGVSMNTRRYFNGKVYVIDVFYDGFAGKKGIDNPDTKYWIDIVSVDEANNQDRIPPSSRKTMYAEDVVKTLQDWKDSMLNGNNLDADFNDTEFEDETEIE